MKLVKFACVLALTAILWTFVPLPGTMVRADEVVALVPAYFYPSYLGSPWDDLNTAAARIPIEAIMNPDSGPGSGVNSDYVTAVQNLQAAGGKVIGYVATGYGTRDTGGHPKRHIQLCELVRSRWDLPRRDGQFDGTLDYDAPTSPSRRWPPNWASNCTLSATPANPSPSRTSPQQTRWSFSRGPTPIPTRQARASKPIRIKAPIPAFRHGGKATARLRLLTSSTQFRPKSMP